MEYRIKKEFNNGHIEYMDEYEDRNVEKEINRFLMICDHYVTEDINDGAKKFQLLSKDGEIIKEVVFDDKFFAESFKRTDSILISLLNSELANRK